VFAPRRREQPVRHLPVRHLDAARSANKIDRTTPVSPVDRAKSADTQGKEQQ